MKTISNTSEQGLMAGGLTKKDISSLESKEVKMKMVKTKKFFDNYGGLKK